MARSAIFIFLILSGFTGFAQTSDSLDIEKKQRYKKKHPIDTSYHHSITAATFLSVAIPGAGQVYNEYGYRKYSRKKNRAWWKVPVIYGGLVTTGYYFQQNLKQANLIKKEYLKREELGVSYYMDEFIGLSSTTLTANYDNYARRRDIFLFATLGVYALNFVEALVDAHFVTFDVSDDLSFNWSPRIYDNRSAGLCLRLSF